jgi:hypothetical protein
MSKLNYSRLDHKCDVCLLYFSVLFYECMYTVNMNLIKPIVMLKK